MKKSEYILSDLSIPVMFIVALLVAVVFKWHYEGDGLNMMGGDAKDYYSYLVSAFITHDLVNPQANEWYLLKTGSGTVNVHPVGVSILLLPFFLIAFFYSSVSGLATDGFGWPFQLSVGAAAMFYAFAGLIALKKLFRLQGISDKVSALMLVLVFFGTNLLHYTVSEAGMSHVYSFGLISVFLFLSQKFILIGKNRELLFASAVLGLILLVRPNNIFVLMAALVLFNNLSELRRFFSGLLRNKSFYAGIILCFLILSLQGWIWYLQTGSFLQNTYKRDGFYWTDPQFGKMLFGFDAGFFVYTPLCALFLFGLIPLYTKSRFRFSVSVLFLLTVFYFFSAYWAYTYFDGLGIRVLVDYYSFFALIGARLFSFFETRSFAPASLALVLLLINLVYTFQINRGILLRAGMTFKQWRYVFLRTSPAYANVLGGSHEMKPFAKQAPVVLHSRELSLDGPADFEGQEFGPLLSIGGLSLRSNRLRILIDCARREKNLNASADALLCIVVEDPQQKITKSYTQFRMNETPAKDCCQTTEYNYSANLNGDFEAGDRLSVYIWNINKGAFLLEKLKVEVYDYNYNLN